MEQWQQEEIDAQIDWTKRKINWDELQPPTGPPNRKDSFIYTGFPDSSPKCCLCGEDASWLIMYGINKWICDWCNVPMSEVGNFGKNTKTLNTSKD